MKYLLHCLTKDLGKIMVLMVLISSLSLKFAGSVIRKLLKIFILCTHLILSGALAQ